MSNKPFTLAEYVELLPVDHPARIEYGALMAVITPCEVTPPNVSYSPVFTAMWRVNTPSLLRQVLDNPTASILAKPLNIFGKLLFQVADRASQIHDPILNALMCQLALYEVADPYSGKYNQAVVDQVFIKAGKK